MECCEEQPLLCFIEQAKNVAGDETVIAVEVTSCGHKTVGTCSCTNIYVIICCILYFIQEYCELWEICNLSEQSTPLLGAYKYTKLQTRWHIHCCYRWINSLSDTLLHSHCSNTVNICTVVMLGFWLCLFNTGSCAWGLCLSSLTTFFLVVQI